jgi:DNA-binding NtrC family response regulator
MSPRILVAEDNETFGRPLQRTLEIAGYDVSVVATAEEVLGALRRGDTDLVLTDIRLSGMDGLTLLRRIKTEYPRVPVIVMTAHGSTDSAADVAALGAADYFVKPFEPSKLVDAVQRALARPPDRTVATARRHA